MNRLAATAVSVLALTCIAAVPDAACAQDYPSHPIKLVLPQPPGGAIDLIARTLGERLSEQMSQPVIVENRPGRMVVSPQVTSLVRPPMATRCLWPSIPMWCQPHALSRPVLRPVPRLHADQQRLPTKTRARVGGQSEK